MEEMCFDGLWQSSGEHVRRYVSAQLLHLEREIKRCVDICSIAIIFFIQYVTEDDVIMYFLNQTLSSGVRDTTKRFCSYTS